MGWVVLRSGVAWGCRVGKGRILRRTSSKAFCAGEEQAGGDGGVFLAADDFGNLLDLDDGHAQACAVEWIDRTGGVSN